MSNVAELLTAFKAQPKPAAPTLRLVEGVSSVYVHAGHLHVAAQPTQISTVLGSCVSICLWDPISRIGGVNHYMLPTDVGIDYQSPRYANFANRELLQRVLQAGADMRRLQASVFGGARIMAALRTQSDLGLRNIEVARAYLHESQIPIIAEDVGSNHGRKLVFRTDTGATTVRRV